MHLLIGVEKKDITCTMYIPFIIKLLLSWPYGESNDLIIQKKSEQPLETCKRATDPIHV